MKFAGRNSPVHRTVAFDREQMKSGLQHLGNTATISQKTLLSSLWIPANFPKHSDHKEKNVSNKMAEKIKVHKWVNSAVRHSPYENHMN